MKSEEAETVLGWIAGGFNHRFTEDERMVWLTELSSLDAQAATDVAAKMTRTPGMRLPRVSEFRKAVRDHQHPPTVPNHGDPARFGHGQCPRFVLVWQWLRHRGDWRGLPQQEPHRIDTVDAATYAALEKEWAVDTDNGRAQPQWGPLTHVI